MAATSLGHPSGCGCLGCLHQYPAWSATRATDFTAADAVAAALTVVRERRTAAGDDLSVPAPRCKHARQVTPEERYSFVRCLDCGALGKLIDAVSGEIDWNE
jgi:hypothetical protein